MDDRQELLDRVHEISDLGASIALLAWDQETMMPPKAGESRARQLATLQGIYHERLTNPRVGDLLTKGAEADSGQTDPVDRALIRELRRDYDRAVKIPTALVKQLAEATSRGVEIWRQARVASNIAGFLPSLRQIIALKREVAEHVGYVGSPYNAMLDEYEPGQTAEAVAPIFDRLRADTVALLDDLRRSGTILDRAILDRSYPTDRQLTFTTDILERMGFDFSAGRQDLSTHPFTTSFDPSDVRITTRVQEHDGASALMGSIHEGGHALYEQGVDPALARTPLASGTSLGMHESQSRLWENFVARGRPFWEYFFPRFARAFPTALSDVDLDPFLRALNVVRPSLIRVEADEVTYNLHIILRFEIERAVFEGLVAVDDLPELWNATMHDYLGIVPPDAASGVLQDIHWAAGLLGYFPTYALGNLYAAQLYHTVRSHFPDFDDRLRSGDLGFLRNWLRTEIHQYGRRFTAAELIERVTGQPLDPGYLTRYLRTKYGALYGLPR